jgi:FkbM family methyltransferase
MPAHDPISHVVLAGKIWDEEVWNWVKGHLYPHKVFYDVGAFFGQMSVMASPLCRKVIAFECNPTIFQCLAVNSKGTNITAIGAPVWSTRGEEFGMQTDSTYESLGALRVEKKKWGKCGKSIIIDDLFRREPVSVMKIDIQGADLHAMMGAKETIRKDRPAIIFEYEAGLSMELGHTWSDYLNFIEEIGYRISGELRGSGLNYTILPKE